MDFLWECFCIVLFFRCVAVVVVSLAHTLQKKGAGHARCSQASSEVVIPATLLPKRMRGVIAMKKGIVSMMLLSAGLVFGASQASASPFASGHVRHKTQCWNVTTMHKRCGWRTTTKLRCTYRRVLRKRRYAHGWKRVTRRSCRRVPMRRYQCWNAPVTVRKCQTVAVYPRRYKRYYRGRVHSRIRRSVGSCRGLKWKARHYRARYKTTGYHKHWNKYSYYKSLYKRCRML